MTIKKYDIAQVTFGQKLTELAGLYGDKTAIVDGETTYTYHEMLDQVGKLARGYLNLGIQKGDHVLLQLPNTSGCIFTIFALARIGAIPTMGLPSLREGDLKHLIHLVQPTAYIAAENYLGFDFVDLSEKLQKEFPCIKHVIFDAPDSSRQTIQSLYVPEPGEITDGAVPKDTVFLLLSGGTTSTPKLIPRTHADYMYNAKKAALRCGMDGDTVYLAALPIAHNFALGNAGILGAFLSGGTAVLSKTSSPDEILTLIGQQKVTHTGMVPAVVNLCMDMLEWWDDEDISCWKVLQVGGSVLESSIIQRIFDTLPCKLQQTFGVAEGLTCMTDLNDSNEIILSCQGKAISELDEIKIVDDQDNGLPNGQFGELLTRGPYTIHGYYLAEEANKKSFTQDGYYRTGDRAMVTTEGNLVVTGRISEQINRAGEKIMPIEIEESLCRHPDIKEASVVGLPDEMYGHKTCAFIITEEKLDLFTVNVFLKDIGLAEYKQLDEMFIVEAYPLTTVGKVDKNKLKEMAMAYGI